jgi:hypothetical protein
MKGLSGHAALRLAERVEEGRVQFAFGNKFLGQLHGFLKKTLATNFAGASQGGPALERPGVLLGINPADYVRYRDPAELSIDLCLSPRLYRLRSCRRSNSDR